MFTVNVPGIEHVAVTMVTMVTTFCLIPQIPKINLESGNPDVQEPFIDTYRTL